MGLFLPGLLGQHLGCQRQFSRPKPKPRTREIWTGRSAMHPFQRRLFHDTPSSSIHDTCPTGAQAPSRAAHNRTGLVVSPHLWGKKKRQQLQERGEERRDCAKALRKPLYTPPPLDANTRFKTRAHPVCCSGGGSRIECSGVTDEKGAVISREGPSNRLIFVSPHMYLLHHFYTSQHFLRLLSVDWARISPVGCIYYTIS
jgi:hypothetical protein